ncbi:MAG: methionine synthase [Candidatus Eisenbacteria bacterium]|uniref:Methionine synthase n=1 Tax=Eiseniibacteriota bacterium TaxID=2212470 RepID=A0A538SIE0_UNCEI|nr:MAG: methionine synthase [Candidatus Eisenbacteria bacterium]
MPRGLWTTTVGSFPKPPHLERARNRFARGEISEAELRQLEREATIEVIRSQEEIGLDILVDGELYRGDMTTYFAELMDGFEISNPVRSYGNRYYRKPVATGRVRRTRPWTVDWWKFAQSQTKKPVKGMLTGPYTMMDWSFNEHYPSREALAMDLAEAIREEAMALAEAGAKFIQVDEPAISVRPEELKLAVKALGRAVEGVKAKTITHICYGDFDVIYPALLDLPVDMIDLEMANSRYDLLDRFRQHRFTKEIGYGVLDVHSHRIETKEEIKQGILRGLELLRPEQMYIDPDCGLKTRTVEEAKEKLAVMVAAVREVREERGITA